MELAQIGADVYACLQPDTGSGCVELRLRQRRRRAGGRHHVGPAPHPRMIDLYATVSPGAARRLVNTHHNGDHCWGNQLFAETGTEIIGHRLCAEWFTRRPPRAVRGAVRGRRRAAAARRLRPRCGPSTSTTSCSRRRPR